MVKNELFRKTKIVGTIGPSCSSVLTLERMINAGMKIVRINFSHGTHREHASHIINIREAAKKLDLPVAIMQDLPGPKERTGKVKKGGVVLKNGSSIILTTKNVLGDETRISVDWADLPAKVKNDDLFYIGDGNIKLQVISTTDTDIKCRVINGGRLDDNKGINAPGVSVSEAVTSDDFKHIEFGIKHDVDFIAISFIKNAGDVLNVKRFLNKYDSSARLIAKIERSEALENLDEILEVADGIMVARGDLGVEIPLEKVPVAQKMIIEKCSRLGKPVIVATQMLESMVELPRPTRAEVTDVANAIYDGADAIMLSEETAIGQYPVEAVEMMSKIAIEVEAVLPYETILASKAMYLRQETDDAISYSACHIAQQLQAAAIVAFTFSGNTARRVSRYRPKVPILAITSSQVTRRQLCLSWGVNAYAGLSRSNVSNFFQQGAKIALESGLAKKGDLVIVTGGVPLGVSGSTNLLKVEKV